MGDIKIRFVRQRLTNLIYKVAVLQVLNFQLR